MFHVNAPNKILSAEGLAATVSSWVHTSQLPGAMKSDAVEAGPKNQSLLRSDSRPMYATCTHHSAVAFSHFYFLVHRETLCKQPCVYNIRSSTNLAWFH